LKLAPQLNNTIGVDLILASRAHRLWAENTLQKIGLRAGQEMILLQLLAEEGISQTNIAERLSLTQPTICVMLRRMEQSGLVERQVDQDDARASKVYLTDKGRALEEDLLQAWSDLERQTLSGLNQAEKVELHRLLSKIRTNLE
jgi:DNA-binding MarR family transcriptional regulator